jgi:prepilin-type N-terminal cleavage/methylation domain-containing protein/prepilin-type processing-associated H-X9-DG protein
MTRHLGRLRPMVHRHRRSRRHAFTLIELLVVIAIIAVLAAIIFPVFARARAKAQQTRCLSNLKQLGVALRMYMDDYDGLFPWGLDAADRNLPQIWNDFPGWQAWIPWMPLLHDVVDPYVRNKEVWHCASDSGFDILEDTGLPLPAHPSCFAAFGSSYMYRTELTFRQGSQESLQDAVNTNVMMDGSGGWHGGSHRGDGRWNVLYGDGHVKSANQAQYDEAWGTELH